MSHERVCISVAKLERRYYKSPTPEIMDSLNALFSIWDVIGREEQITTEQQAIMTSSFESLSKYYNVNSLDFDGFSNLLGDLWKGNE
jgi:hypothetical protein